MYRSSTCMFVTVGLNFVPLVSPCSYLKYKYSTDEKRVQRCGLLGRGKVIQIMDRENIVHEELRRGRPNISQ